MDTPVAMDGVSDLVRPIRVRFVGVDGNFQSVATQGYRVSNGIKALNQPRISSEVVLVPSDTFAAGLLHRTRQQAWRRLVSDVDIVVIIKSSVFKDFGSNCQAFKRLCRQHGVVLVSSPADGPGADADNTRDPFSENVADFVLSTSRMQHEYLCTRRNPATVFAAGVATRPPQQVSVDIRERVGTVVWENPAHHDPRFNPRVVALSQKEYADFESEIRKFCTARGARLLTFGFWRDDQTDDEWQELMLGADIAIECKGLGGRYTKYQLQKPPTKLQNYLALGLPVVCDSIPSYAALGKAAQVRFADSMDEWTSQLSALFESRELRAEMQEAALKAVAPLSIERIAAFHVECFEAMLTAANTTAS